MRIKARRMLLAAAVLLLAALLALAVPAGRGPYRQLLLAVPAQDGAPGQDTEDIEELCAEEFLITYEIRRQASAQAANSSLPVTLAGTNACYPDLMGYRLLDGGFFTKSAWDMKSRHAVLNETAAFRLFGSSDISGAAMRINGETWIITGVLRDGEEENPTIYAPSSVTGGRAESLTALLDRGVTQAYVKNALKGIGIYEDGYVYVDLSRTAEAFWERLAVAWKAALCAGILLLIKCGAARLLDRLRDYQAKLRHVYFRELLARSRPEFIRIAADIVLLAAGAALILFLSLQILETCLGWQELNLLSASVSGSFSDGVAWLRRLHIAGISVFTAFLAVAAVIFILAWKRPPQSADGLKAPDREPASDAIAMAMEENNRR